MLVTSGESLCLHSLDPKENDVVRQLMHSMSLASAGAQALVGLAAMVLGILGLTGIASTILVLVALLATSALIVLRSSSVGGLLLDLLQR